MAKSSNTTCAVWRMLKALRPITLPQNMTEVGIDPHEMVSTFAGSTSLRARYGITNKVQLGLTYAIGGIYDDPETVSKNYAFHAGKASHIHRLIITHSLRGTVGKPSTNPRVAHGGELGVGVIRTPDVVRPVVHRRHTGAQCFGEAEQDAAVAVLGREQLP